MRSLYGSQFFSPTYLPIKPVKAELLERIKPQLSDAVTIGADLRTIWASENTQSDTTAAGLSAPLSTNTGTIAQMQGTFYLSLQPADRFLLYYSQGIAQYSGRFEAYGLASVLPFSGFVKAGQFQENFGWVFADHTAYVRTGLFMNYMGMEGDQPRPPDYGVGAEIGVRPKYFDITASFTNAQTQIPFARDNQKRWFARAQVQQGIQDWGLQLAAGGSWFNAPAKAHDPEYSFPFAANGYSGWGGFGGIGWDGLENYYKDRQGFGFLATALLFEYDRKAWTPGATAVTSAYSTTQLSVQAHPGIWLYGAYDWLDNGRIPGLTDPESKRTTLGLQIFPLPWVEISPRYRLTTLSGNAGRNKEWAELQAHFQF